MQFGPSHELVVIVSKRVIFFFDEIHKRFPSGFGLKNFILLCGNFLIVSLSPSFYMGGSLKEHKGDLFPIEKIVDREITF
jgi:hypothetical protein